MTGVQTCALPISGHANHGEYGEDIVCSSVSSVSQMTLNGLMETLKLDDRLQYEEKEGYIVCDLDKSNLTDDEIEKSQILILSMYSYLKAVEESYGKYVKIRVREV